MAITATNADALIHVEMWNVQKEPNVPLISTETEPAAVIQTLLLFVDKVSY